MGILSSRYSTPIGGIGFLAVSFLAVLALYGSGTVSLITLLRVPNATFILTYLSGCAAGIRLLKDSKLGAGISALSFFSTLVIFPFVGWAVLYPLLVIGCWAAIQLRKNLTGSGINYLGK